MGRLEKNTGVNGLFYYRPTIGHIFNKIGQDNLLSWS